MNVVHDKENQQFILKVNDAIAKVDYVMRNNLMYLVHSEVPVALRGKEIGKKLVEQTFEILTQEGYKAVAICSYVKHIAQKSTIWKHQIS